MEPIGTNPKLRPTVTPEYSGKWIAWAHDQARIIASGDSLQEVRANATKAGDHDPIFEKVPRLDAPLVGRP